MLELVKSRIGVLSLVIVIEIALLAFLSQIFVSFECQATDIETACRGLRSGFLRGVSVLTLLAMFFWLRPSSYADLRGAIAKKEGASHFLVLHFLGMALLIAPFLLFSGAELEARFDRAILVILAGSGLAGIGAFFWLLDPSGWRVWIAKQGGSLAYIAILGVLVPDLANLVLGLWDVERISRLTFSAVQAVLQLQGETVLFDPQHYVIGANGFNVQIAAQCSGVEGFALISVFSAVYALMMGRDIHQRRFWLVVFPSALVLSWTLNVFRIALLILIGINGAPEHAQNGFHSYAGWLVFTLLALCILGITQNWQWVHPKDMGQARDLPLAKDWLAARIVPFILFMVSGVLAKTFWEHPETAYPFQVIAMAAVVWVFRKHLYRLSWRPDGLVVLAGGAIGAGWAFIGLRLATGPELPVEGGLAELGGVGLLIWVFARLLGTIAFVPLIEELFFRGYVLHKLDGNGPWGRVLALLISSGLFGLLHDRWAEGFVVGLIFGLIYLRKIRLGDAIIAHAIANAVVGATALATGIWTII